MSSAEQLFIAVLRSERTQEQLFSHLANGDIGSLRQASTACCNLVTKRLFTRIQVSFTSTTFTKSSRVAALARIGHHVEHLTFFMAHSEATFLPPLVHPLTGQEISFLYTPHTSMGSVLTRPKYANSELGDILTQQYPPLFHAATNVASFINAFRALPNMRHLTVRCPGQDASERYRRSIVDYALISLRIAVERCDLAQLRKLSLSCVHASAFSYLRHSHGFGTVPSATRRWRQIRKLYISVEAWDFAGASPGHDHLKIMDDYVRFFAPRLEKFSFSWTGGRRGPCAVALSSDALFAPPRSSQKLFHEVTSPMSPLPTLPPRAPIHFPVLRYLQIRNTAVNAPQVSALIKAHRKTVKEFSFENVVLAGGSSASGSWNDALAPLDRDDSWSRSSVVAESECSFVSNESSDSLPFASAAVQAASRELLDFDLGPLGFSDEQRHIISELSEQAAATETAANDDAPGVTTKLRKKHSSRRRRHHKKQKHRDQEARPPSSSSSRSHKAPELARMPSSSSSSSRSHKLPDLVRKLSSSSSSSSQSHSLPSLTHASSCKSYSAPPSPDANISAPILTTDSHPVLLQPTVYDPSAGQDRNSISAVQRNIEQEEAHRLLAEDAGMRINALQRAKAAVLSKLSREFGAKRNKAADAVAACRLMASREWSLSPSEVVLDDYRVLESQTALVPLMFSRG